MSSALSSGPPLLPCLRVFELPQRPVLRRCRVLQLLPVVVCFRQTTKGTCNFNFVYVIFACSGECYFCSRDKLAVATERRRRYFEASNATATFKKCIGMAVPKTTEARCRDGSVQARHVVQRLHN